MESRACKNEIGVVVIALCLILMGLLLFWVDKALAEDQVYDKYDVRGLNAVYDRAVHITAYGNQDVPHVHRESAVCRMQEGVQPKMTVAESQVAYSACVRGVRRTRAYLEILAKEETWDQDAFRTKKAVVISEEIQKCNDQAMAREESL